MENNEGVVVPVIYKTDADGAINAPEEFDYPDTGDTFFYDGTMEVDGTTYDKWRKIELGGDTLTWDGDAKVWALTNVVVTSGGSVSDPYFANCKLSAWEIKYSLDNDKTRFWWAMDGQMIVNLESGLSNGTPLTRQPLFDGRGAGEYQYAWGTQADVEDEDGTNFLFSKNETLVNGEDVYNIAENTYLPAEVVSGKGVIYYMKDEYDNECPYDFKNIQFNREGTYYYTFSWVDENNDVKDLSIVGNTTLTNDEGQITGCYGNKIGIVSLYGVGEYLDNPTDLGIVLNNNVFISSYDFEGGVYYGCSSSTLGDDSNDNTFGNNCNNNTFGDYCKKNTFGDGCSYNTFGDFCNNNNFEGYDSHNTFGDYCNNNTFGVNCYHNTFGNNCNYFTFGYSCDSNTFGNNCDRNTFGNNCTTNTFGSGCQRNTFGNGCENCHVDTGVRNAQPQPTTGGQLMQGVHIHYGVTGQFTVVRGANYTQDVRTANDVTITV